MQYGETDLDFDSRLLEEAASATAIDENRVGRDAGDHRRARARRAAVAQHPLHERAELTIAHLFAADVHVAWR